MSDLTLFLKKNKKAKENTFYAATQSITDEKGKPVEWEIRALTTKQDEAIRDSCTREVQITGKPGVFRAKLDSNAYLSKMVAESIVYPNLNSADLQDSYGVNKPEDLLKELIDNPGEYQELAVFIQNFNGFNKTLDEKVEEAKN